MKASIILRDESQRRHAVAVLGALSLDVPHEVQVKPWADKRSLEQNSRLWAMLNDIARQVVWPVDGQMVKLSPEEWKIILTSALTQHQRVAKGIHGGFVMLGQSTRKMNKQVMCDLQELMAAFGAEHSVRFSAPEEGPQ